jgi:hypothetical protein
MLAMIAATLALAQAGPVQPPTFWVTSSLDNVFRDARPPSAAAPVPEMAAGAVAVAGSGQAGVFLTALKGQTVSAQIVLLSDDVPNEAGLPTSSPLKAGSGRPMPATAFRAAFVDYVRVEKNSTATPAPELARKAPDDFPDPLSDAATCALRPRQAQPVWVAYSVPRNAVAGDYAGEITIPLSAGALRVPVRLTVLDAALPADTRLKVTVWMDHNSLAKRLNAPVDTEAFWTALTRTAAMMRDHHQNVILTPWSLIGATRGADGKLRLDFARFDRWVEIFLAKGFQGIEISHMGGRKNGQWEDTEFVSYPMAATGPDGGKPQSAELEEWLPLLQEHLKQRDWLSKSMIHVADEPIDVNVASWRQLARRVKRAAPQLRRIDAVHVPDLAGDLEVWVPQLNYYQQWEKRFEQVRAAGSEVWFYTAWVPQGRFPNRLMDYPLIKTRMLQWFNYTTGTTGYLHWGFNQWEVPFLQFAPGDNAIVYPGDGAPKSSLRYEAMREGIEDHEMLCMLEDRVGATAKRLSMTQVDARNLTLEFARQVAAGYETYTRSPARLEITRAAIGRAIVSLNGPVACAILARQAEGGEVEITGFARPGAVLSVGGMRAAAGADGRFSLAVAASGPAVGVEVSMERTKIVVQTPVVGG